MGSQDRSPPSSHSNKPSRSQERSRNRLPQLSMTTLHRRSLSQEQERKSPLSQDRSPRMLHALSSIKFQSPPSKSRSPLRETHRPSSASVELAPLVFSSVDLDLVAPSSSVDPDSERATDTERDPATATSGERALLPGCKTLKLLL